MSTLGQLSGSIAQNLGRVDDLTKWLIAIRADMLGKVAALKLTDEQVAVAKKKVAEFLDALAGEQGRRRQPAKAHFEAAR